MPSTQEYLGLEHLFEFFGLFPAWFTFVDVDVPNKQADMLTLFDAMTETEYSQKHPIAPYLSMFALIMSFGAPQFLDNTTFTHPLFAPSGVVKSDIFYPVFNAYRYIPLDNASAAFEPQHGAYTYADLTLVNEFQYYEASEELDGSTLQFSFFPYFIMNLSLIHI